MTDGISPQIHKIRVAFNKDLFVERREELEIARQWQTSNRRVLTITSPPANGKTWFLAHFQNLLQEEQQIVFKIDVTAFLLEGPLGKREIDHTALQNYISDFVEKLREKCDSVPNINASDEASAILTSLAGYVSMHCWPGRPIYLFVDGSDEPSSAAWKTIEKQILEPIIAHPNWHLIVALRETQRLYSYLLRQTEKRFSLPPLPSLVSISREGQDQVQKLISQSQIPTPPLADILAMLPGYNWVHLGLNHFLFLEACYQHTRQQELVGDNLLKRGITALTPLHDLDEIVTEILKQLQSISQLPPEWSVEELAEHLDQSDSVAWETIKFLQKHMLITNIDNRHQITPGVREFVRSLTPIRLTIRIDKNYDEFTKREFILDLSSALAVPSEQIKILETKRGSVIITLEMPQDYFVTLLQMFIAQDSRLEKLRLLEIEMVATSGVSLNGEMQQGLEIENKNRLSRQKFRQELRPLMEAHFNLDELRTLCFDLVIEYENFDQRKKLVVIGIIELCERNGQLSSLLDYLEENKPAITWPTIN